MDDMGGRLEKGRAEAPNRGNSARRRQWWRGLGTGVMVLMLFLGLWLIADMLSPGGAGWQKRSEEPVQYMIMRVSFAWIMCELLAQWGRLLRSYCFARAETTERIRLFDHLRSAPVRLRIARHLYFDAWVLVVLILLYSLYSLLRMLI